MKLNTLLKTVVATKIEITDNSNNFKTYKVNYLSEGMTVNKIDDMFEYHPCKATLPKSILKKDVKYVDIAINNTLRITIF